MTILKIGRGRGSKRTAIDRFLLGETFWVRHAYRECKIEQFVPTSAAPDETMFFLCDGVRFHASSVENAVEVVKAALDATFLSLHPAIVGKDLRAEESPIILPLQSMASSMAIVGSVAIEIESVARTNLPSRRYVHHITLEGDRAIVIVRCPDVVSVDEKVDEQMLILNVLVWELTVTLKSYGFKVNDSWQTD